MKHSVENLTERARQVVVVGAGPAGATTATLLAQRGLDVLLLDKDEFPRFHIGESMITETWWILKRLGLVEWLEKSDFPEKYSVQFISEEGRASKPFYFWQTNEHESHRTWQVERSEFDHKMVLNAREQGVEVRHGCTVDRVLLEGEDTGPNARATGVRVSTADGRELDIPAEIVVDASGMGSILSRQLKILRPDPKLLKAALFAHYENGRRDEGQDEGATLIIDREGGGWFWYIPLSKNRISIGVVGDPKELLKGRGKPEQVLTEEIERSTTMRERLASASRQGPVRVVSDFSYRATRCAGDGWVLVGDAFGFIDPVYSTGVFLALKSGEMAADTIAEAFEADDLSGRRLGAFGPEFAEGMEAMRKLVYAFYTPGFSFAGFVRQYPEHRERLVDLLTGNVFKEGIMDIFDDMKEFCDLPETMPLESGC